MCLVVSSSGERGCAWLLAAGEREGVLGCWQQGRERVCLVVSSRGGRGCAWLLAAGEREGVLGC